MANRDMDYVFAAARVRSVEKNLLSRERADKMADSRTPEEALKILYELGYSGEDGKSDLDGILSSEIQKSYEFILGIAPDQRLFDVFLYPYDYHNIKVLLKAEFLGVKAAAFLSSIGTIAPANLEIMLRERSFSGMPAEMARAAAEAIDVFGRTGDPQAVDLILDQACYRSMTKAAEKGGNAFIQGYVRLLADIVNVKAFVRLRQMGKSWDFFSRVFVPGGIIGEKTFIAGYEESYEQFSQRILSSGLSEIFAQGAEQLSETGRFTLLEKLCDDRTVEYATQAKYVSFGPEPLAAYLIARESDARNARIILAGLAQGLSRELIRERQRVAYV